MLAASVAALGTRAAIRFTASGYMAECTSTSAPLARVTSASDRAVSPEMTIDQSGASKRYANAGVTGG